MEPLSESTRLLYAQLLSQCLHGAAPTGRGLSFVAKRIRGARHWYLQLTVGSRRTQHYLGPDTALVRDRMALEKARWKAAEPDVAAREQLVAMLVSGGAHDASSAEARVIELLEQAGVFVAGGVIVGSHAFALYGNMLGVRWDSETTRTQDMDIAGEQAILVGVDSRPVDLRRTLVESDLGFIEIPALDRKSPSTRFRIRGRQLSVHILTPMLGRSTGKPVHLPSLNTFAEPVRFLDYLLVDHQPAVFIGRAGLLVNVPSPARFALHKLVVAERRVAAFQSKRLKDLDQAAQLLQILLRDRPGDLRVAWSAALKQPARFMQQLRSGLRSVPGDVRTPLLELVERRRQVSARGARSQSRQASRRRR